MTFIKLILIYNLKIEGENLSACIFNDLDGK
jgi:hypothetical protein